MQERRDKNLRRPLQKSNLQTVRMNNTCQVCLSLEGTSCDVILEKCSFRCYVVRFFLAVQYLRPYAKINI